MYQLPPTEKYEQLDHITSQGQNIPKKRSVQNMSEFDQTANYRKVAE